MNPKVKEWWQSKTFWVNTVTLVIGIITTFAGLDFVKENPQLTVVLSTIVLPFLNNVLRWLTKVPITSIHRSLDVFRSTDT